MEPVFKLAAKEANIDPRYITTKMYRKTFISWMIAKYPEKESSILLSAGHTQATMRGHYLAQGFKKDDYKDIDERTRNWGMAR
jgi:integrase